MAKSNKQRQKDFRDRKQALKKEMESKGFKLVESWIHKSQIERHNKYVARLPKGD